MFVIILDNDSTSQFKTPPLLLPISKQLLTMPCSHLQQLAHIHFHDYLSPFIRKEHLQLSTQKQTLKPDYPIFIYCNFEENINNLVCALKPYDEGAALKRSYLLKNSLVLVNGKDFGERIVKQNQVEKIDKLIKRDQSVFVAGKEVQLRAKAGEGEGEEYCKKWSELVMEKWSKFQSPNYCVYLMI